MKIHFGTGNSSAEDYYYIKINAATASALGVGNSSAGTAGYTISTQSAAQNALGALDSAITLKDNIRANLGALANRLSNTVSNLTIQAENLQAAESRISDVDVATEMTEFVRNQILTQAAVAMLAQANALPQLALPDQRLRFLFPGAGRQLLPRSARVLFRSFQNHSILLRFYLV
jgi:flagellin